jgi:hypothetical protein
MGAAPVILIGQDLAYTGGASHATGYFNPQTLEERKLTVKENGYREIDGYWGDKVYTDRQLDSFRQWYEGYIIHNPSEVVINATEGGAKIAGALQMSFAEASKQYAENSPVNINDLWPSCDKYLSPELSKINEKFENLIQKIKKFKDIASDGAAIAKKLSEKEIVKAEKKQDRLHKISNKLKTFDNSAKNFIEEFVRKQSFHAVRSAKLGDEDTENKNDLLLSYLESLVTGSEQAIAAIEEITTNNSNFKI